MRYFAIILVGVLFFSCGNNEKKEEQITTDTVAVQKKAIKVGIFKGLYANHLFKICSDSSSASISIMDKSNSLDSIYSHLVPFPSTMPIIIEVEGNISYDNENTVKDSLIINKVLQSETKNFKNTCIPYDFWCIGNEPFWQIQISEKENMIDLYQPMEQKYSLFNFVKPVTKDGNWIYKTTNANDKLEIIIRQEKCSDGMSERKYNYSVKITLNDKQYRGCAVKYGEPIDQE